MNSKIVRYLPAGESIAISRRGFLRGAGVTTAGTVMVNTGVLALDKPEPVVENNTLGPGGGQVRLCVHGDGRRV